MLELPKKIFKRINPRYRNIGGTLNLKTHLKTISKVPHNFLITTPRLPLILTPPIPILKKIKTNTCYGGTLQRFFGDLFFWGGRLPVPCTPVSRLAFMCLCLCLSFRCVAGSGKACQMLAVALIDCVRVAIGAILLICWLVGLNDGKLCHSFRLVCSLVYCLCVCD